MRDWHQNNNLLTGIITHPGRNQPHTVWHRGYVIAFRAERIAAETALARAKGDEYAFRRSPGLIPLGLVGVK